IALGAPVAYALLLRVPVVRNHSEGYVVAFAVAVALAGFAVARARARGLPPWTALALTSPLLIGGAWFNFVGAQVPRTPTALRVGERAPDFTLTDAAGRPTSLADHRGQKPGVLR